MKDSHEENEEVTVSTHVTKAPAPPPNDLSADFKTGDEDLEISLGSLEQIYLGFDEVFPRTLVKNFGLFCQPLRLTLSTGQKLYLIIDYSMLGAKNQLWFNGLKEMLSK
jgi:hypothetical protein